MKAIAIGVLVAAGCTDPSVAPSAPATNGTVTAPSYAPAYIEIQFTDSSNLSDTPNFAATGQNVSSPPRFWVDVASIKMQQSDGSWVKVATEPQQFDLLRFDHGNIAVLASAEIPAGGYAQLAVEIDAAVVDAGGYEWPYTIKYGSVFLPLRAYLANAMPYALVVDLDGVRSLASPDGTMTPVMSVQSLAEM